jgi:signal transduction histidine kinase
VPGFSLGLLPWSETVADRGGMSSTAVLPTLEAVSVGWIKRRWDQANDLEWPWWMALGIAAAAVVATVAALLQRDAVLSPQWSTLFGVVILLPWLAEHLVGWKLPRLVFGAIVVAGVAGLLANPAEADFAPFILVVLVGELAGTGSAWSSIPASIAAGATLVAFDLAGDFKGSLYWCLGMAIVWDGGFAMQWQQRLLVRTKEAQESRIARAATEERQRIASEVHDVIAHSLSVTMLHLTAARHVLTTDRDVTEAIDALEDAERLGRQAMSDIRRTVGLLETADGNTSPMPSIDDIEGLIDGVRSAGTSVDYQLVGDPGSLTPGAGLDLYRIMQESLANAVKHAPGADVDARLDLTGDPVRLTVCNTMPTGRRTGLLGPDGNGGSGLRGMRQRVELLGGAFDAGPDAEGWRVSVTLPRSDERSEERDEPRGRCPARPARR